MTSEAWSVGCARVARALRNGALDLDLVGEALDADALGIRRSSSSTPRVSIATAHTRLRAVTAATRTPGAGCHCPPTYRQQPVQSTAMKCLSRGCFQEFSCRGSQPPATRFRWCPAESRWPSALHPPSCSLCAEHPSTSHTSILTTAKEQDTDARNKEATSIAVLDPAQQPTHSGPSIQRELLGRPQSGVF